MVKISIPSCNFIIQKRSNHYYALFPLHHLPSCCRFNYRAHRRVYIELYSHFVPLDTGRYPCHFGYQRLL